ncbi:class I adenylate-forming enzyme family protein [Actinomadura algeriensis]|uniref:Acyl-CoA synthetase (AMP-forming)/AMP-acid ligase II n=1 Tax=Actinomadura algeriensis TaxID=1679523 RepID=A0ABR9JZ86_9ACTN|nr:AMP-binding protein [Actinomadura algeriensis]MBE1535881.1 acyl-CoA synthetase (AMP-forming)/AMP-acid ligase II [Actinomadura algeriensis]
MIDYRPMIALGDFLRLNARRFPDRPCFVRGDGGSLTYADANSRVNRLADALAARGVTRGTRLAILAVDGCEYYEVLLASLKLGATYVPLNNRLKDGEVATLLGRAAPKALFVSSRYVATARRVAPGVPGLDLLVHLDGTELTPYGDLLATGADVEPCVPVADTDIVGLFTSGTTGLPKGALQSHGMVKSLLSIQEVEYEWLPGEFRYTASPAFHIAGQAMVLGHIKRGYTTLILPQFDPASTLRWMDRSGGLTGCFMVPTMIRRVLDLPGAGDADFSAFRSVLYGGAPMPPGLLHEAMDTFGCRFVQAFGASTEGGLQTVLTSADHERAVAGETHLLGSIGRPAAGVELRLVDAADDDVPVGEVGEIITRSDAVMSGYLEMPEESAKALKDGWFRAGDLARRDAEGFYYLAGRSKDMIIRGGENIYPVEIETVIADCAGVASVAVVGRPDAHWGETVVAYVTLHDGAAITPADIRRRCLDTLAKYKVPETVTVLPEMPLNASGKILKRELRRLAPSPA